MIDKRLSVLRHGYGTSTYDLALRKATGLGRSPLPLRPVSAEAGVSWQAEAHLQVGQAWRHRSHIHKRAGEALRPYTVYKGFKNWPTRSACRPPASTTCGTATLWRYQGRGMISRPCRKTWDTPPAVFTLDVHGHVTDQMKKASADRMGEVHQSLRLGLGKGPKGKQRKKKSRKAPGLTAPGLFFC